MNLPSLAVRELAHKLSVAEDEISMGDDSYKPIADSLIRVLKAGTKECLRSEPLALAEVQNLIDIAEDNLDSTDSSEIAELRRYIRTLKKLF